MMKYANDHEFKILTQVCFVYVRAGVFHLRRSSVTDSHLSNAGMYAFVRNWESGKVGSRGDIGIPLPHALHHGTSVRRARPRCYLHHSPTCVHAPYAGISMTSALPRGILRTRQKKNNKCWKG
ncbi:hypothetical protein AVEN_8452-1 [Araneus ventricosus]|uniref:Uncharacterized protein n=1 Tax=Araneus ventricosus TaxID=182803 RepID=A0A4Y2ETT5_ARAVE|nr:hypothetical protein AVEN_8452-1 [Araneus ventricosus]